MVEKSTNVGIEQPLHPLAMEAHTERIERLVWTATGPEPIRKAPKVHLVNLVKDGHYCLLDNFVLQGGHGSFIMHFPQRRSGCFSGSEGSYRPNLGVFVHRS